MFHYDLLTEFNLNALKYVIFIITIQVLNSKKNTLS